MVATEEAAAAPWAQPVAAARPSEPEAIFVVGVARSGTTMMRSLLETSDRIAIARENHFVGHLIDRQGARFRFRHAGDLTDDAAIRRIIEFIYSGEFQRRTRLRRISTFWRWLIEKVPREEMERRLLLSERTERGLMAAFMRVHADMQGKPVMGEKTPAHLAYVDTLLDWFPNGRVIHMMRDPRAVYISDSYRRRTKRRKPYGWMTRVPLLLGAVLLVQTTLVWRSAARRHERLERRYPGRYMLVRFEDVVQRPDEALPRLFDFLGVEVPPNAANFKLTVVHGMRQRDEGLDPEAAERWRKHIHPFADRWLSFFLGGYMRPFGYAKGLSLS
ncbi:MAG: sulfotransferase [Chloroflexota bacterium]